MRPWSQAPTHMPVFLALMQLRPSRSGPHLLRPAHVHQQRYLLSKAHHALCAWREHFVMRKIAAPPCFLCMAPLHACMLVLRGGGLLHFE